MVYIFFVLFGIGVHCKNARVLNILVIIISIAAAVLHFCVIKGIFVFPYAFWVERTCRMLPPFLFGEYLAKEHKSFDCIFKSGIFFSVAGSFICILLATYAGDGAVTIILMYICTFLLWIACPNFKLKSRSIIKQDMFSIYAVHEGVIVAMLALINKLNLCVSSMINIVLIMIVELIIIFGLGWIINLCLKKLPPVLDIVLTGGRNIRKMEK